MRGVIKWLLPRPQFVALVAVAVAVSNGVTLWTSTSAISPRPQSNAAGSVNLVTATGMALQADFSGLVQPNCQQVACIALTFDDGPNPLTTPQILTTLEQMQVPASFFVVGSRVVGNEALLQRMRADGDLIGNHSWSHPDFTNLPADQVAAQIDMTQQAVLSAGVPAPAWFRLPYGAVSPALRQEIPLKLAFWNEDPKDWAATSADQVKQAVEAAARPGGVVDLHDIYHVTADALPNIVTDLRARGFHFVTLDQLGS